MKINVTQEDIDEGVPGSCSRCPIAKAFKRQNPTLGVSVDGQVIQIFGPKPGGYGRMWEAPLPEEAKYFVVTFDRYAYDPLVRDRLKPFSFDIDMPWEDKNAAKSTLGSEEASK